MVSIVNRYNKADRVLCIAFVLFLCALVLKHFYHDIFLVKALLVGMEAALVGGVADWFAVTALFRRPLGFPWHTAIIPNNRVNIIEATAHMVQYEFFSKEKLRERIQNVRLVEIMLVWVEQQNVKQIFGVMAARHIGDMLKNVDPKTVAEAMEKLLKMNSRQLKLAPVVQELAKWVLENRKDEQLLDNILKQITEIAERASTRQAIYDYLQQYKEQKTSGLLGAIVDWIGEKTNAINIDDAADSFHQELISLLKELSQPSHPLRVLVHQRIDDVADQVASNPVWSAAVEKWKEGIINQINLQEPFMDLVNIFVRETQCSESLSSPSPLMAWILATIDKYWAAFRQDQGIQDWVENYLQEAAYKIIDSEHDIIGVIVKDAMQVLSDEELNRLIESKTSEDLQWIRINGSIVGGVAGLVIFLIIHVAHNPALSMVLR
jgi:uncharacterized membrane-anchored protein YjiN (DUF445 family)